MQPEGMVHALEEIHRLLRPAGCLVDIHPAPSPTLVEVHRRGSILFSAPVPGQTFQDVRHAENALAQVIEDGRFALEGANEFDWRTYASSVAELRDYVAEQSGYEEGPSTVLAALREGELAERARERLRAAGEGAHVALFDRGRISRLNRVTP